jgi:hypothetical protein
MKDQYFGDVNDYKKYAILRTLALQGPLRIAIAWMLTGDDQSTDGRRTNYLNLPRVWRAYDPDSFDILRDALQIRMIRSVAVAKETGLIANAVYHSELLYDGLSHRASYFHALAAKSNEVDLIFLDPDNGIEVKSRPIGSRNSRKYLYHHEIERLYDLKRSLLIYQHFRRQDRGQMIQEISRKLSSLTGADRITTLRTSHTVFFLKAQNQHRGRIDLALRTISQRWHEHIHIETWMSAMTELG